jgi:O-antigen ligase
LTALFSKKIFWFYFISVSYLLISIYFIYKDNYIPLLIPVALLIILVAIFAFDKLIYLIAFFVPLSLPLSEFMPQLDINMSLPTEPLLLGILLIFIIKVLYEGNFDKKILVHPVSLLIYLQLLWILITSITSTMPVVSFKFLLSRLWFLASFYFLFVYLFKDTNKFKRIIWLYSISLLIVIGYTLLRHSHYGFFDQEAANFVSSPLYNDHTAYGAALGMIFCILTAFMFLKKVAIWQKIITLSFLVIVSIAIIFSYTRATWISMLIGLGFMIIMVFRIKFKFILLFIVVIFSLTALFWTDIVMSLERNRQDSSSDFAQQIQSISNISTDASNMERLNRWNCAIRMFKEKPIFGWGPGTYMFQYVL